MKAFKFLALVTLAIGTGNPVSAENFAVAVTSPAKGFITSVGATDTPGSCGSNTVRITMCNRSFYFCRSNWDSLVRSRNSNFNAQYEVRSQDRSGYPRVC